jgi:hypothetical protein
MLGSIVTEIEENRPPDLTASPYLLLGMSCCFVTVDPRYYADYVGIAPWFYRGKHFPLHQIMWPSTDGHYPWSQNASKTFKEWQPILGEPKA